MLYANGKPVGGGGSGGNANDMELTYAEYEALSDAEKMNGTTYYITDINGDGSQFQPVIYSTEEREVGVWIDGKPLYEIAYERTSAMPSGDTIISGLMTDCETVVKLECYLHHIYNGTEVWTILPIDDENGVAYSFGDDIRISLSSNYANNRAGKGCIVKIQYTKSTDTAGSGTWTPQGVPTHKYSTEERIVGTWIDGSTLYEKTYVVTFSSNYVDVQIPTTHKIKGLDGGVDSNNNDNFIHLGYGTSQNDMCGAYEYEAGKIRFQNFYYSSRPNGWLTVRYTKTS